jgi:hypothetical protein
VPALARRVHLEPSSGEEVSSDEDRSRKRLGYVRPIPQDPTACLGRPT